nr:class D beta-lactamase [Aureimonas fodinaquatilis]
MKILRFCLAAAVAVLGAGAAQANSPELPLACTIIADVASGEVMVREGTCDQRFSPMSSFKLPLAVMGFDSGILKGPNDPVWQLKAEHGASKREQAFPQVDPTVWEHQSIVWYSQDLTRKLGDARFGEYVSKFNYGNGDVSGDAGQTNGLTRSWLMSSLRISPDEQVQFLRGFVTGSLPVSEQAIALTREIIPGFSGSDGWAVQGKTGSGWLKDGSGKIDRSKPLGWFVGWAEKNGRSVVFARLIVEAEASDTYASVKARTYLLEQIGPLLK